MKGEIANNYEKIMLAIEGACRRSGRVPEEITLVAVSKRQPVARVQCYLELLQSRNMTPVLGENYVQEFARKRTELRSPFLSHLIGPLQSNKAREAVRLFDVIESVHSEKTALAINKAAEAAGKVQDIFLQVNISSDSAKSGFEAGQCAEFVLEKLTQLKAVSLKGLMTITREYVRVEDVRPDFAALRGLRDNILKQSGPSLQSLQLSMGMSVDYVIAIEEGANLIRVGSALFGARSS